MRLKITIDSKDKLIPFEYHGFLQAVIYKALSEPLAQLYHDKGFGDNRIYKMFVFSELIGNYKLDRKGLIFTKDSSFYISSVSAKFLNDLFIHFSEDPFIKLGNLKLKITNLEPIDEMMWNESHEYFLSTISPITCYKTDEKHFTTFFHPKSQDFEESLKNNLKRKYSILYNDKNIDNEYFEILEIDKIKSIKVKYKCRVFQAYNCVMKVKVSDKYLKLLMHTGLGAKNAAGFGMMHII